MLRYAPRLSSSRNCLPQGILPIYPTYHLQLDEIHHTQKLDAPSGTAITLAEGIMQSDSSKKNWVNEQSEDSSTIGIVSHREADVKGTHIVEYVSNIDI